MHFEMQPRLGAALAMVALVGSSEGLGQVVGPNGPRRESRVATASAPAESAPLIRLKYASFDPLAGGPIVPKELEANAVNELYLVQFATTPTDAMRSDVMARGGEILRYMTDRTHIVRIPASRLAQVSEVAQVRWVGAYHPAYRLDPELLASVLSGEDAGDTTRYSIECMRQGLRDQQAVADEIVRIGGMVHTITPDQYRLEATLTRAQLLIVAGLNEVSYIDSWGGPAQPDMNLIRQLGGAVPLLSNLGFLGQGVRAEVFDTGVVPNHIEWNGQAPLTHHLTNIDGHGNACYGINFSTGVGNPQATGMLPMREQGIFCWAQGSSMYGGPSQPSRLRLNAEATDPSGPFRSVFQTSSVGTIQTTQYNTYSAEVDDYLFRVDYLSFQSQSNTGSRSSRPEAWAKNVVSVGGIELQETLVRTDDVRATGASIGPASDLRVKPDLSHAFSQVFTTYSGSFDGYDAFGGTSAATPIAAGHGGLLQQMWHAGTFPNMGSGTTVFSSRPRSTTAKAMLINGAYRYPINSPITNSMYRGYVGWGTADLTRLYNERSKLFIVDASDPLIQGQTRTYALNVAAGEPDFRATMIFPDPMGSTAAAQARVNDLSLKVTDPNGVVYYGNSGMVPTATSGPGQLAGANVSTPGGPANTYDTVENVFVASPPAGTWTVQVVASEVVQDAFRPTPQTDAVYSLVVANAQVPAVATGACCLPAGTCTVTTGANCVNIGGTYAGNGVACGSANCPAVGACCGPEGTCAIASASTCAATGGTYRGDNTDCATAGCGPGACCFASGVCLTLTSTACLSQGGVFAGSGVTCSGANCPQPSGVYTYNGQAVEIPDGTGSNGCGMTAVAEVQVPDAFTASSLQVGVFVRSAYQGDHRFRLIRGSTTVELVNRPGVNANNTFGFNSSNFGAAPSVGYLMSFVDTAPTPYAEPFVAFPGVSNTTGTYRPVSGQLGVFVGQNAQGVWRLEAEDCAGSFTGSIEYVRLAFGQGGCYANCDGSTASPTLNVADFTCFLQRFAAGDTYANCDGSTTAPTLNVADFTCFLQRFAAGCP